jgi:hypothetical protein
MQEFLFINESEVTSKLNISSQLALPSSTAGPDTTPHTTTTQSDDESGKKRTLYTSNSCQMLPVDFLQNSRREDHNGRNSFVSQQLHVFVNFISYPKIVLPLNVCMVKKMFKKFVVYNTPPNFIIAKLIIKSRDVNKITWCKLQTL